MMYTIIHIYKDNFHKLCFHVVLSRTFFTVLDFHQLVLVTVQAGHVIGEVFLVHAFVELEKGPFLGSPDVVCLRLIAAR